MLDTCLLGTGGTMPLPYRWFTSMIVRCDDSPLLIDCDEGAQIAFRGKGWNLRPVNVICFTYYRANHISGLPGLFLTMGNAEHTEPLLMIGPKGLERVVTALRSIAPEPSFPIVFSELTEVRERRAIGPYAIGTYRVSHSVLCHGYCISIPRIDHPDAARTKEQGVPLKLWNPLQKRQTITDGDKVHTPDMVPGDARHGLKVSCCTDTRPVSAIAEYAADADLMICEGMYGEADKQWKVREHKRMTIQETAKLASEAKLKELWLTYYGPSPNYPEEYMAEIRKIFPAIKAAKDGWTTEPVLPEEA